MAPLTTSAINKSKTVVPKAIPRRRPAPAAEKSSTAAEKSSTAAEKSSTPTPVEKPSTLTPAEKPSTSTPVEKSSDPTPAEPVADAEPQRILPTPPPTQPILPTPPTTQSEVASQQPEAVSQPAPHSATLQQLPETTAASPAIPSQSQEPEATSAPSIPSPATVAGTKRKRTRAQDKPDQTPVDTATLQDATEQPTEPSNTILDTDQVPQTTETPHAAAAASITPTTTTEQSPTNRRSTRGVAAKPVPAPAAPPLRAKRQKKGSATAVNEPETEPIHVEAEGQPEEAVTTTTTSQPKPNPKPKTTRARKQTKSATQPSAESDHPENEPQEEQEPSAPKQRKPRQPRKPTAPRKNKVAEVTNAEVQDGDDNDDAEDPELHEIDPNAVTMSDLTRDRGLGKQSDREAKMATIDWDDVARKRLEAAEAIRAGQTPAPDSNRAPADGNEDDAGEGEDSIPRPRPGISGPRLRVDATGKLVVDPDSLRIDRQAQAAANAANLVVTEEDDLTKRVNQMSWLSDRKKDPTERLPFFKMKSDPWSDEETDRFYDALNMFGTDFFIISKMFPPKTRRQIKLKFIREERLDAARVNRALSGESTVPMSLDHFAEATGQDVDKFKDPRELEEELRVESESQRQEIAKKKKETEESKHQREVQMAAREKEQAERAQAKKNKAMLRRGQRGMPQGTGTF